MPSKLAILLFAVLLSGLSSLADIAPTKFTGTNVFPLQNADVRMTSADVRITWGDPCTLEAKFVMTNESSEAQTLEVGFPVGAYHDPGQAYDFGGDKNRPPLLEAVDSAIIRILVNDTSVTAYRRLPAEKIKELGWSYTSWYFAKITFQPGANTVDIRTRLSPSGVYGQPYKRTLAYCISTGGRWKGPIGRETVEIQFPGTALPALLSKSTPAGGHIQGDSIRWEFTDFEPVGAEHDIELTFKLPRVVALLAEMKRAHERNPDDMPAAIRYAVHLFSLGAAKGNSGFPPSNLSAAAYQDVLAKIDDQQDRSRFSTFYSPSGANYVATTSEWTDDRSRMIQILADGSFSEPYPGSEHVEEGRKILEGCLARQPENADAWAAYLAHFWRFSFAAAGHWFGSTVYSTPLRRAIETAYKNCPTDARIQRWHEAMTKNGPAPTFDPNRPDQIPVAWQNEFNASQ